MTRAEFVDRIETVFATRGGEQYAGEAVSQLEHALQGALLAETAGAASADIAAALLHDIGHLLHNLGDDCADRGVDDKHEELGLRFLRRHLPPEVTEPVRLHVQAKRYLCRTDPAYFSTLSNASVTSLKLQGGPMSAEEVRTFEANPHHVAAVALRRRDDGAKTPRRPTPPFAHYRPHLETCLVG